MYRRLLGFLERLGSCVGHPAFPHRVLEGLQDVVPFDLYALSARRSACGLFLFDDHYGSDVARIWIDAFDHKNSAMIPGPQAGAYQDQLQITDWRYPRNTEFANEFIRPQHIGHTMAVVLKDAENKPERIVGLQRGLQDRPFNEHDLMAMRLLLPHLQNYFWIHGKLQQFGPFRFHPAELGRHGHRLSRREAEIASLLCLRLSMPEIATRLGISVRTVETHVSHIYEKLDLIDRADLLRRCSGGM
jgi:DNA-binding CsgD family transcriptional regulator